MLRPVRTRWFELVSSRPDLPLALEALACTGSVELETLRDVDAGINLRDLRAGLLEFARLTRRYRPYWPVGEPAPGRSVFGPAQILENALRRLRTWERSAAPVIRELEIRLGEQSELRLFEELLGEAGGGGPDFSRLAAAGPALQSRVFVLPPAAHFDPPPPAVLQRRVATRNRDFLIAVGQSSALDALTVELAQRKSRVLRLPLGLPSEPGAAAAWVGERLVQLEQDIGRLHRQIDALSRLHYLAMTLGELQRLQWFLDHVSRVPVSENFAWVTGWTDDATGRRLRDALQREGLDVMLHFPPPPATLPAPLVLRNPWWARPFEVFARLLGTPGAAEADPSVILALLTPLLFGYMFGDVGQGFLLFIAGMTLRRRWPLLRLLIPNGLSAMAFGWVFGSVFGQEGWITPLWVNPVEQPLPVLAVPLAGGAIVLLLGQALNVMQAFWRGEPLRRVCVEGAVPVLYLALVAAVFKPGVGYLAAGAALWFITGSLADDNDRPFVARLGSAAGALVERVLQLLLNTLSFVRVGAFALAHSGLSLAFAAMASTVDGAGFAPVILLLGNLITIALEGLVVSIQTSRLILFEFFIRFLRGEGRNFRPLAAPGLATTKAMGTRR